MIASPELMGSCVTLETMIPELLARHPAARDVLDAYGLRGCGGPTGPAESLAFFARTHGVDPAALLREIGSAASRPAPARAAAPTPSVADTIYRRYFLGGIILILSAGATWGAWLLLQIGMAGKFTGVSIHAVNAHGHAQIYGWVGLFIMGFAYQAFPRMWHTTLARPRLAVAAFALMAAGLIVRTVGMTAAGGLGGHAAGLAMLGGAAEVGAILIFAVQLVATFRRSAARVEPYVAFAFAAVVWFGAQAALDLWHTWATMTATTHEDLLWHVATYQAPLRDLQVHGLALFMILGVSLRMVPALFGVPATPARRAWWGFALLTAAVVGEVVLFVGYRWMHNHWLAAALLIPWMMLAAGCWLVAAPWGLWRKRRVSEWEGGVAGKRRVAAAAKREVGADRSFKFVRVAYGWLAVSLTMLLLLPVYQHVSGIRFSHAYYGAIRHAITVGFVSMMIMGMAAKVVPTLGGVDVRKLSALWGPFVLVNTGCFLRVSLQTLTDVHPAFYAAVGISGILEVSGLAWWGTHLARIMIASKRAERRAATGAVEEAANEAAPDHVARGMYVLDVLRWFPRTAEVFDRHGFALLRNPIARRTLARRVTVETAAYFRGVELAVLLDALAAAAGVRAEHACEHAVCQGACDGH